MNKTKNRSVKTKTPKDFKTCFVSKQTGPRSSMLRFVADEGGVIYFDVLEKLPGRGLWLMPDRQIVCKAIEKNLFQHALQRKTIVPADFYENILRVLRAHVLEQLALARKTGVLVFGFEAVKKALFDKKAVLACEALDCAENGQEKLSFEKDFPVFQVFSREALGQIAGQDFVVHMAVLQHPISVKIKDNLEKIIRLQKEV